MDIPKSPYRENAYAEPGQLERRWLRAALATCAGLVLASVALAAAWASSSWRTNVELRAKKEDVPPHVPFVNVVWNGEGTTALTVGGDGEVFRRTSELGDVGNAHWERFESDTHEALKAIASGNGPGLEGGWFGPRIVERTFAVGERGAFIDCTARSESRRCVSVRTGTDDALRAVAIDGWQAVAVGDHGVILHVRADADRYWAWRLRQPPRLDATAEEHEELAMALKVDRVDLPGLTADLRFARLECSQKGYSFICNAVVGGEHGVLARGVGVGRCDDGFAASGAHSECKWTWSVANSGEEPSMADARGLRVPVHAVHSRLWARDEEQHTATLSLGASPRARFDDRSWPISSTTHFVAGAWPLLDEGRAALLISEDGAVYLAR